MRVGRDNRTWSGQSAGFETRVVAVGSEGSGKTALLRALAGEPFLSTYEPTVFGEFVRDAAQGRPAVLLCDTSGREDLAHLRPRLYADADAFLVCFSLASRQSLQDLPRWVAELELLGGRVPWVLVATHGDLRGKPEQHVEESTAELCGIAQRLGALAFFELSSKLRGAELISRCPLFSAALKRATRTPTMASAPRHRPWTRGPYRRVRRPPWRAAQSADWSEKGHYLVSCQVPDRCRNSTCARCRGSGAKQARHGAGDGAPCKWCLSSRRLRRSSRLDSSPSSSELSSSSSVISATSAAPRRALAACSLATASWAVARPPWPRRAPRRRPQAPPARGSSAPAAAVARAAAVQLQRTATASRVR